MKNRVHVRKTLKTFINKTGIPKSFYNQEPVIDFIEDHMTAISQSLCVLKRENPDPQLVNLLISSKNDYIEFLENNPHDKDILSYVNKFFEVVDILSEFI